jgi:CRP/FNR family transcriptional regulator
MGTKLGARVNLSFAYEWVDMSIPLYNAVPMPSYAGIAQFRTLKSNILRPLSTLAPGSALFHQGDPGADVIQLVKGTMCSYHPTTDGERLISSFILPGESFCLSFKGKRAFSVEAISECLYRRLTASEMAGLPDPKHLDELIRTEAFQLHTSALDRLHRRADEKTAAFILDLAFRSGGTVSDGSRVRLEMSRADMAAYLAVTIETMVRSLKRLCRSQIVQALTTHEFEIRDLRRLRQYAGD